MEWTTLYNLNMLLWLEEVFYTLNPALERGNMIQLVSLSNKWWSHSRRVFLVKETLMVFLRGLMMNVQNRWMKCIMKYTIYHVWSENNLEDMPPACHVFIKKRECKEMKLLPNCHLPQKRNLPPQCDLPLLYIDFSCKAVKV